MYDPTGMLQQPDGNPGNSSEQGGTNPNTHSGGVKKPNVPQWSGPMPDTYPGVPSVAPAPTTPTAPLPPVTPAPPMMVNGFNSAYNPTTSPFGFDMTQPGQREQFWNNNQAMWFDSPSLDWVDSLLPQFQSPWEGEKFVSGMLAGFGGGQHWNGKNGGMNTPTAKYKGPNNAQTAFDMTKQSMPGTMQPQFDAYYDRMKQKAMSDANAQAAGRGIYGSNSALNGAIGAGIDIEAQRAKAGTDFALADSANQLNWFNSLSNQGRTADLSGLGIFGANMDAARFDVDKMRTIGDLAFGLDDARRSRLNMGLETGFGSHQAHHGQLTDAYDAAGGAQDSRERRIGQTYDDVEGFSSDVTNYFTSNYDKILSMDEATFMSEIEAMVGQTADARGWSQQQQDRMVRDATMLYQAIKGKQAQDAGASRG